MALSEGDLAKVRDFLLPVRQKWYDIGLELKVESWEIDEIKAKYSNFRICLREMLRARLRSAGNPLTWNEVTKAKRIYEKGLSLEAKGDSTTLMTDPDAISSTEKDPKLGPDQLKLSNDRIKSQYARFVSCLCSCLEHKELSVYTLRIFLFRSPIFEACSTGNGTKKMVREAKTVRQIIEILSNECASYLHFDIFQLILAKYCTSIDHEDLNYSQNFIAYVDKLKVSEFVEINPQLKNFTDEGSMGTGNSITFKVNSDAMAGKFVNILDLQTTIASTVSVWPSQIKILSIQECFATVTFHIPLDMPDVEKFKEHAEKFLSLSVQFLECKKYKHDFQERETYDHLESTRQANETHNHDRRVTSDQDGYPANIASEQLETTAMHPWYSSQGRDYKPTYPSQVHAQASTSQSVPKNPTSKEQATNKATRPWHSSTEHSHQQTKLQSLGKKADLNAIQQSLQVGRDCSDGNPMEHHTTQRHSHKTTLPSTSTASHRNIEKVQDNSRVHVGSVNTAPSLHWSKQAITSEPSTLGGRLERTSSFRPTIDKPGAGSFDRTYSLRLPKHMKTNTARVSRFIATPHSTATDFPQANSSPFKRASSLRLSRHSAPNYAEAVSDHTYSKLIPVARTLVNNGTRKSQGYHDMAKADDQSSGRSKHKDEKRQTSSNHLYSRVRKPQASSFSMADMYRKFRQKISSSTKRKINPSSDTDNKAVSILGTPQNTPTEDVVHPSMENLTSFVWTDSCKMRHKLEITKRVSAKYATIGILIGLDLAEVHSKQNNDSYTCCVRVFSKWIANNGCPPKYPKTWTGVCQLLYAINELSVEEELKEALESFGMVANASSW